MPPGEEAHMRTIFDLARRSTHGFESYARQVGKLFADDKAVLEDLLGGLFHIALADGALSAAEDVYLREVARLLVPELADWCIIALVDSEEALAGVGARAHAIAEKEERLRQLSERFPLGDPALLF